MKPAHRIEAVLPEDGKLTLENLPFQAGQAVEVTVQPATRRLEGGRSLAGTVVRYDDPLSPVAEEDWDALR